MDKAEIGQRIKKRRTELKMTQGDIAQKIGVAISTVQRYEAGTIKRIKLPVISAIAHAIQVNPEWLVGKSPIMEPSDPKIPDAKIVSPSDNALTAEKKAFIEKLKYMDDSTISALNALADSILSKRDQ
jgi:transcriptional regulator with XRE-family HTH domain